MEGGDEDPAGDEADEGGGRQDHQDHRALYSTKQYSTVQYSTAQHLGVDLCRDAEQGEGGHEAGRDGGGDRDHAQRPPACASIPSKEKLQTSFNCKGR